MSGIAIIKEGADFSSKGLGKVTRKGETSQAIKLQSLSIKDVGKIEGGTTRVTFTAEYTPANTQQTAVRWVSLEPDILYFSDPLSGLARVVHGDQEANVEVLCISVVDSSIYAHAIVAVASRVISVTGLSISGADSADGNTDTLQYTVSYTPSNTTQTGVEWSSSDEKVATVDANGLVTFKHGTEDKTVAITATSKYDATLHAGKTVTVKAAPEDTFPYFKVGELLDGTEVDVVRGLSAYSPGTAYKYVIGKNAKRFMGVMRAPRADVKHFFDTTNPDPASPLTTSEIENFNHLPITLGKEYIGKTLRAWVDSPFSYLKFGLATWPVELNSYWTENGDSPTDTGLQTTEARLTISARDFNNKDHCFVKIGISSTSNTAFTDDEWTAFQNKLHFEVL